MDPLDAEIEAARAELAALRSESSVAGQPTPTVPTETPWYSPKQLGYDIATGALKAGWGLADLITTPGVALARAGGLDVPYFGISKMGAADLAALAPQVGIQEGTLPQQIVEFATPIPGGGKVDMAKQAGLGLASLLGMRVGEKVAPSLLPESLEPYGGLIGALGAPAGIVVAGKGIAKVAPSVRQTSGVLLGSEEALQKAANEAVVRAAGQQGAERIAQAMSPAMTYGTAGTPLTAAELAQTPSMALAQAAIQQTPEGALILTPQIKERGEAITAALGDIGLVPQQGEMAAAMRDRAAQVAAQKLAQQEDILTQLGLTPEARAQTTAERGAALLESLQTRQTAAQDVAEKAWQAVPGKTQLDVKDALSEALDSFDAFGKHAKADTSKSTKRIMADVRNIVENKQGITTVDELQDLRSAAGRAYIEASGANPRQQSLMTALRDSIDNAGIKYLYDQEAGVRGGLPGTAKTKTDLDALTKLSTAIESTRTKYKTFGQGVVGDLLKMRKGELVTKASKALDKALKTPEGVEEIGTKFGKSSNEFLSVRAELLNRLEKAKDPASFISKHEDVFNKVFDKDVDAVRSYAKLVNADAPLEDYAKLSEAVIPKTIFADSKSVNTFVNEFKGTLVHDFAKSKFLSEKLLKRGTDPLNALKANKTIAKTVLGDDYTSVETLLKDKVIYDSPSKLAQLATKGQSWTHQLNTAFGAMMSARGLVNVLQRGIGAGGLSGAAYGAATGAPLTAIGASVMGLVAGYGLQRLGNLRASQLNSLEARIMANPTLLKLATAPATKANVKTLTDTMEQFGFFGAKAAGESAANETSTAIAQESPIDIDAEIEAARRELESLRGSPMKQDVSFLINDAAERYGVSPKLVNAVVKTESASKSDAVSPKGAQGLMQLMPKTAKALGVEDPTDPAQNIEGGVKYLAQLIKKFGDEKLALAAYNWGEGNIRKQLDRLAKRNKPQTLAAILKFGTLPTETENYIKKISRLTEEA